MIEFNGYKYSGSVNRSDDAELVVSINTVDTLQDICIALNDVKSVKETLMDGTVNTYTVNNAVQVTATARNCYTILFSKKLSVIEEMSNAIDALLVMALEK